MAYLTLPMFLASNILIFLLYRSKAISLLQFGALCIGLTVMLFSIYLPSALTLAVLMAVTAISIPILYRSAVPSGEQNEDEMERPQPSETDKVGFRLQDFSFDKRGASLFLTELLTSYFGAIGWVVAAAMIGVVFFVSNKIGLGAIEWIFADTADMERLSIAFRAFALTVFLNVAGFYIFKFQLLGGAADGKLPFLARNENLATIVQRSLKVAQIGVLLHGIVCVLLVAAAMIVVGWQVFL